ncbi:P-loop containing nucleoside triphosphate hydrolase protein [Catenaria anguillulae PL171]|uniref:p-loop containing nucleoside triphosphate hydrolase protein n=1 Tax=Catenaria anguillulae PL171 TaxID=765915 RepID=A0A1Y2HV84_9FUNG|nr:P-loop containing nucleoside triphosphate hydrolase protein [Catenaria anguillulae PL171]
MPLCVDGWSQSLTVFESGILDFTTCFHHGVLQTVPAAAFIAFGLFRVAFLVKRDSRYPASATLLLLSQILSLVALVLALPVQYLEHVKLPAQSTLLSVFFFFRLVANLLSLKSYIRLDVSASYPTYFLLFAIDTCVSFVALATSIIVGGRSEDPDELPENVVSVFSRFTFAWVFPLMRKANNGTTLTIDDIYKPNRFLTVARLTPLFNKLSAYSGPNSTLRFLLGILSRFWVPLALSSFSYAINIVATFVSPALLERLLAFVSAYSPLNQEKLVAAGIPLPPVSDGVICAVGMFLAVNLRTATMSYGNQLMAQVRMRVRTLLTSAIYQKALGMSLAARKDQSIGEIVNRMSTDTNQVISGFMWINDLWSLPVSIALALYFLYGIIGPACFAGLAVIVLVIPASAVQTRAFMRENKLKLESADKRIKLLNEVISGMKTVKLYGFEDYFRKRIVAFREKEQEALARLFTALAMVVGIFNSIDIMITLFTFLVYSWTSSNPNGLSSEVVFVSMAYLNIMIEPIGMFFHVISEIGQAVVSFRRISEFLHVADVDRSAVTRTTDKDAAVAIEVVDGGFKWDGPPPPAGTDGDGNTKNTKPKVSESEEALTKAVDGGELQAVVSGDDSDGKASGFEFELTNVNLRVPRCKLVALVGRVGTGKTSLLHGILGEMHKTAGRVQVNGSIAYVPQSAWIFNGTLRENILLNNQYDDKWYSRVIEACALKPDLDTLSDGDQTLIGDKGVNLSGGQKARLSLARAVYARRDIYLLDDCLSAVDAHVDRHIFTHVLGPRGLLRSKSVLLVTHGVHHLPQCDDVALIKDGTVFEHGTFDEVMAQKGEIFKLVTEFSRTSPTDTSSDDNDDEKTVVPKQKRRMPNLERSPTSLSHMSSTHADDEDDQSSDGARPAADRGDDDTLSGKVTWAVYKAYLKACGRRGIMLFIPFFAISLFILSFHSYWMKIMSTAVDEASVKNEPVDVLWYLYIYAGITAVNVVNMGILVVISLVIMSVNASRELHATLIARIMRAPMRFFDTTPAGRIVNRFSSDIDSIDFAIPLGLINFMFGLGTIMSSMVVLGISTTWVLLVCPFTLAGLFVMGNYYLNASRELKRMDSNTTAPIYQKFEETLHGIVSIRAYQVEQDYTLQLAASLDRNIRAKYLSDSVARWLSIYSTALASLLVLGVGLAAVFTRGSALASSIGLGITQANMLIFSFRQMVDQACQMETTMVSVERVQQYSQVDQESPEHNDSFQPPKDWPQAGVIEFDNYSTTYRPELDPVLKNLSITIAQGQKVGIVGRTGSGKSTMTLALFRIMEALEGRIKIDGVDVSQLGLKDLRSQLCIIPQDPMLFAGSLQDNLDPLREYDDAAIWRALELANMSEFVSSLEGKLEAPVDHGGSNFSSGQKQLLTLAAAILRKRKIVIFDEATSATDAETDAIVQRTIRQEFKECSVLTIAHRINTIYDSDMILVLDQGKVAEFAPPQELLKNEESLFTKLVRDSQSH